MLLLGTPIDKVPLEIDYGIIEHFSKHLYSSPNKAIEELVVNGYDAAAENVKVYLFDKFTDADHIVIWDDGLSMDVDGIKGLWKIANSPKKAISARTIGTSTGVDRHVIGKFGIGKIASYTVGNQIAHICKSNSRFLAIGVDYQTLLDDAAPIDEKIQQTSDIYELTEDEAKTQLTSAFQVLPVDFDDFFRKSSWTFAVVEKLKKIDLPLGRLRWVLSNAMPIQPNFVVYLNDQEIIPSMLKNDLLVEWDFGQQEVIDHLTARWKENINDGKVTGEITFGKEKGLDPNAPDDEVPFVQTPLLGKIWGKFRLYNKSLFSRANELGRSHGFFIVVLGRLINQDDAQFFLHDPSFATFYSSQWILNVDGLDSELLADRERVLESSPKSKELKIIQKSVYLAIAARQRKEFDVLADSVSFKRRLPIESRQLFMEPLTALWVKSGSGEPLGFDFRDPKIEAKPMGTNSQVSSFSVVDGFKVNSDHPYYKNLNHLLGGSKNGQKVVKEFEVVAVSEKLFEGYLFEIGISDDDITKILRWRDEMYRKIARSDNATVFQLSQNLEEASYKSGAIFEDAIVEILNYMGFVATRDGKPGQKDVFVNAYCGEGTYKITFEGKGCASGSVANDDAETGGANNHRKAAGAEHAVIVARKFAGFDRSDTPAIIGECKSMGMVSIMETEALTELAYSIEEYSYSIENLKDIFTTIESPKEKLVRIQSLRAPLTDFNYPELLETIWNDQAELGDGGAVSLLTIWQKTYRKQGQISHDQLITKVEALQTIVFPLLQFEQSAGTVALKQTPNNIIKMVQERFSKLL